MDSKRATLTSDIGFAIRDALEGECVSHIDTDGEDVEECRLADKIEEIDISDVDNPVFHMESGARFTVRIVRSG